jgi:hypothetical protein
MLLDYDANVVDYCGSGDHKKLFSSGINGIFQVHVLSQREFGS